MQYSTKSIRQFLIDLTNKKPIVIDPLMNYYKELDKTVAAQLSAIGLNKPALLDLRINNKYPLELIQYYYLHWVVKHGRLPDYKAGYYLSRLYFTLDKNKY